MLGNRHQILQYIFPACLPDVVCLCCSCLPGEVEIVRQGVCEGFHGGGAVGWGGGGGGDVEWGGKA